MVTLRKWWLTEYQMDSKGGWIRQPVIIIEEGNKPYGYIKMLESIRADPTMMRGTCNESIGRFQDFLLTSWDLQVELGGQIVHTKKVNNAKSDN
jgi:hypothetical protein